MIKLGKTLNTQQSLSGISELTDLTIALLTLYVLKKFIQH